MQNGESYASLMVPCEQEFSHVGTIHSRLEGTAGSKQNQLLRPADVLNDVGPLTFHGKIVDQSTCYYKFLTKYKAKTAFNDDHQQNI